VPWVAAATLVALAVAMTAAPDRLPPLSWPVLAGAIPVSVILLLTIGSRDASAGSQLTFCWPLLFAAYQLRPPAAWLVTGMVVAGDISLCLDVKPLYYVEDATAVPIIFLAITLTLVSARGKVDKLMVTLRHDAEHDALTGLATRRRFDVDLELACEKDGPVSLLLVDVDHFKYVNDSYGHSIGDDVLKGVARCLEGRRHSCDSAYRLGGDELAVLLVGCPPGPAMARAEEVRRLVETVLTREIFGPAPERALTVSIGVASSVSSRVEHPSLLRAADQALYAAKDAGRNQVATAAPFPAAQAGPVAPPRGVPFL
jgi:diguanylate cyclase (GGDEF)-like protein